MDTQKDLLSIKDCVKEYGIAISTLRRWIKKGELPATLVDTQYVIQRDELENLLVRKNISRSKITVDTQEVSASTHIDTQADTLATQLDILKKENEYLKEKIGSLERTIAILEQDKEFLQGQVQNLINTINMLTTRQLPPPGQGLFTRLKNLFRK
jgi:phage antirepressor YoqD-like protein